MALLIASGCRECNGDIRFAEENGPRYEGYLGTNEFWNIPPPRPRITLDGEDFTGKEVYALVLGNPGYLLKNAIDDTIPPPPEGIFYSRGHLCPCGSQNIEVELYQGHVGLMLNGKEYAWTRSRSLSSSLSSS